MFKKTPSFDQEFDAVMETLKGAYNDRMYGEDKIFKEGYRNALAFAIEIVNRRLGQFAPKKQDEKLIRMFENNPFI